MHDTKENKPVCESCSNTGTLTNVNGIWLCADCMSKELETASQPKPIVDSNPSGPDFVKSAIGYISNTLNKDHEPTTLENLAINKLGSQAITKSEDFFNARTMSINERWKEIVADDSINAENKHYVLAKEVREHYLHLKNVLFNAVEVQLECAANQRADQIYLNTLASKLREEERVKLHLQNIDYVPPAVPVSKPKAIKVSKDDKIAADYARIMNIPIETARRLLNSKLSEVVGPCTCSSTPGICKVHK